MTTRIRVILQAPGFSASWIDTPERIEKLLRFATECIVEAQKELKEETEKACQAPEKV